MSIEKISKGDELSQSENIVETNIDKLKALFPEIVTEGKIDFKVLQEVLGEELEEREEYYRFTWAGKANARREAQKPSTGTLRPAPEESVDWDTTENLYIEGDNLEVLKLLQKGYAGKVKMIYIDPPYNTGKDFVYKDNYKDNLRNYQEVTGQIDEEGNKLSTNSDSDGRYHSNWINMMYPRLRLARNVLKDDGVIFMSIDDNESYNLKKICDEVFGENNFIASLACQLNPRGRHLDNFIAKTHETVLVYGKNVLSETTMYGLEKTGSMVKEYDRDDARGKYRVLGLRNRNQSFNPITRPNLYYPLYVDSKSLKVSIKKSDIFTEEAFPITSEGVKTCWTWGKDKVVKDNHLLEGTKVNSQWQVFRKDYLMDDEGNIALTLPKSLWNDKEINNDYGKKAIKKLFGKNIMDFPKSPYFIEKIIECGSSNGDIIMDFFSGSATTSEAVFNLNARKAISRNFIQIQIPELTQDKSIANKEGYATLTDMGKERIRRAAKKIKEEHPEKAKSLDLGFKVFKLDTSNIKGWDGNPDTLNESLFDAQDNIKTDRTEHDVLYEILLKYGLDLTLPIEEKQLAGKTVFSVGYGALFICLADNITNKVAEGIGEWKEVLQPEVCRVVFKDSGFTDVEKTNSVQTLKRFGISEIKSI
ncbi:site-specific DNA-methyltransferase [Maribacter dokdonensis]|uniref:site-specific DNA-methyltransferase n=2 Tax=Maribacter dokdonensis TaxID=320912 RepID=UPI0032980005